MTDVAQEHPGNLPLIALPRSISHGALAKLVKVARHPSLIASVVFLFSGAAFAVGNLLLARTMSVDEFGRFALALALFNIIILIAPLGIDQFVLRHRVDPHARLIGLVMLSALLVGGASSVVVIGLDALSVAGGVALTISIVAGAVVVTANAGLRSAARTRWGLAFTTGASWLLLAMGIATLVWPPQSALGPLLVFAAGNAILAVIAVSLVLGQRSETSLSIAAHWREVLSLLGIAAVGTLALQVERLLVPGALSLTDLATFAVLASTAIFPFRLLVAGTSFSLVPRLRKAIDNRARRKIVRTELLSAGVLALLAALGILIVTPVLVPWLTSGMYRIGYALTAAACLNGISKLAHAMASAIVTGCGGTEAVHTLNRLSFAWLALACAGGWAGAYWGLIGLLVGVSVGGLLISIPTVILACRTMVR